MEQANLTRKYRQAQGWLLAEREQLFGFGVAEFARRFDRSTSWVSRLLALGGLLSEAIQLLVREGKIASHLSMKDLVPAARVCLEDCQHMTAAFVCHHRKMWRTLVLLHR